MKFDAAGCCAVVGGGDGVASAVVGGPVAGGGAVAAGGAVASAGVVAAVAGGCGVVAW